MQQAKKFGKPMLFLTPDQKIELSGKIQDNFFRLYQKLGIKIGLSQIYELAYIANKIVRIVSYNGSDRKSGRSFFIRENNQRNNYIINDAKSNFQIINFYRCPWHRSKKLYRSYLIS